MVPSFSCTNSFGDKSLQIMADRHALDKEGGTRMAREDKVREVSHLLQMADQAHHKYEIQVLHGKRDENWYEWYAEYLIGHGIDRVLEDMVTVEKLAKFLSVMDEVRKGSSNPIDWRSGTARRMVDTLV